jgi:fucose permease
MMLDRARTAVYVVFALNGMLFASLVSRIPDVRAGLSLDNGSLGLLLLALAVGSLVALPTSGALIARFGARAVVTSGGVVAAVGVLTAALGATTVGSVALAATGLVLGGAGVGVWDVAMNVEGAEVERRGRRTIMPRFHAVFSLGAVAGALTAVPVVDLGVPVVPHLGVVAVLVVAGAAAAARRFLPVGEYPTATGAVSSAWTEPRTLLVGVVVLAFALAEGTANDWLALALVDGHDTSHAVGVAGFALFVAAMTAGRLSGPVLLDRFGRAPVLWVTAVVAVVGLLVLVHGSGPVAISAGIVAWGLGASLGFPVGMSAAADDPARAAARVSVVSTIGYAAFLAGPPLLGAVGDAIGTLESLQVVALLLVPASLAILAVRTTSGEQSVRQSGEPVVGPSVEEGADVGRGDRR